VEIACEKVWHESSNYVDGTVAPELRLAMDEHIKTCRRCASVIDGMRNIVTLYGDERMAELPAGFSQRLRSKLEANMPQTRRRFFGWGLAFAASVLVAGGIELARYRNYQPPDASPKLGRREAKPVPPDLDVVVADDGKLFHLAACSLIIDRNTIRKMKARDALQLGCRPCPRCLNQYI